MSWGGRGGARIEPRRVTRRARGGPHRAASSLYIMTKIKVCKVTELAPGAAIRIAAGPEPIAVFRLNDGFYAISDACTHAQTSLAAGDVDLEDCTVECPYHGALFDIRSGRAMGAPASRPVRTYPVKIIDGEVFIEMESVDIG